LIEFIFEVFAELAVNQR